LEIRDFSQTLEDDQAEARTGSITGPNPVSPTKAAFREIHRETIRSQQNKSILRILTSDFLFPWEVRRWSAVVCVIRMTFCIS
jgi:hypothetical protein